MNSTPETLFNRQVYYFFLVVIVFHALAAYALAGLPLPWIALVMVTALTFYLFCRSRVPLSPGTGLFLIFILYAGLDTIAHTLTKDYAALVPAKATSSYFGYIALRFFGLLSFACTLTISYWLLTQGYRDRLIRALAKIGGLFAVIALYIYLAQIYGWYEPTRTRLGTSGGEQSVIFTYAFHRAMGTFREPSHLAEWLVLPLFASFICKGRWMWLNRVAMMLALLLSGSLTGMLGVVGGLGIALITSGDIFRVGLRAVSRFVMPLAIGLIAFSIFAVSRSQSDFSLLGVLVERIEPLLSKGGVEASDRNYVYIYLKSKELSFSGEGLGNANLLFTSEMHIDATVSFLNIFVNYLLSLGLFGTALFCYFLVFPFQVRMLNRKFRTNIDFFYLSSAYFAWVLIYFMHSEEPSFHFAALYALLIHASQSQTPDATTISFGASSVIPTPEHT